MDRTKQERVMKSMWREGSDILGFWKGFRQGRLKIERA